MAFDQNSIPKDLRPLNSFSIVAEEARIAPLNSSRRNIYAAEAPVPTVCYPISDVGLVGVGYSNGVPTHGMPSVGWQSPNDIPKPASPDLIQFTDMQDIDQKYFEAVNGSLEGVGVGGTTREESTAIYEFTVADVIGFIHSQEAIQKIASPDLIQFPDPWDIDHKYFEAVNGTLEGAGVGGTTRKESTAISEFVVADVIGSCGEAPGEVNGMSVGVPMQSEIRQEAVFSRPVSGEHPIISAVSLPFSNNHSYESPKQYYGNISSVVPKVENHEFAAYDHQEVMERGMGNLQIHPSEIIPNNLQNKHVQGIGLPRGGEGETSWNTSFQDYHITLGGNKLNQIKTLPVSVSGSPYSHTIRVTESHDMQVENEDHFEEVEATWSEKMNLRSQLSEGIGRLQVIKNTDLEELRELGSGAFGTVYHGKWRGTDVAIKRINHRCFVGKPSEQDRMRDDFWNEAINLADMHHPNVVAFYGVVLDGPGGSVATVTEYMVNGSLRTALQKNERNLDKRKQLLIAMDIAFGMEYLHGKNIVHFDLKSDNLLVNLRDPQRPICKVGDLGLSKLKHQTLISGGLRGTLAWMAPELLDGSSSRVSEKVDVYSFGIVLWELLTGQEPYADLPYGVVIGGIVSNTLRPPIPESCDLDWRSLMERCWSLEPKERPSFTEISNDLQRMASKIPPKGKMQQANN